MKEQYAKHDQINKELIIENENLNNHSQLQSINIPNINLFETIDKYTQYEHKEPKYMATGTIPLTYKHSPYTNGSN
ncbi:unnamed protein product [Rotaria sp. Silwood1]|nr:unnamed protein product [Rotaria sp. Silwood1]CAF3682963.1 unnamed protein product [Rotaria sp. Silwood1]CAF3789126.1 unnamed protein product [Rotaria sp. Silwood1]CAF4805515.1 unnamed protein product [Rotaria sp. Silwood1]CAF4921625.1 unnamed protein product [Rotaria sp. Silwood1]